MKIWILKNGERSGPHETFLIRDRIASGKLDAETPAWYEGIPEWVTLKDIPSLHGLFEPKQPELTEPTEPDLPEKTTEAAILQAPTPLHPVQRFFARFFDLFIYSMILGLMLILNGVDLYEPPSSTLATLQFIPYLIIDSIFIHIWGASPGKMLLGIRVSTAEGHRLGIGASVLRALRVWVLGFGMFIIPLIALPISYLLARKFGKFLWDVPRNYHVSVKPIVPRKLVLYILILLAFSAVVSTFIPEEYRSAITNPIEK